MAVPRIVILGAGFGGVYVAKKFRRLANHGLIDLTIVNRTNYFLFTPLLHEVATGALNPRTVAEPLREIFVKDNISIVQGTVESINTKDRRVTLNGSLDSCTLPYDYLIIATGAETNYYNIPGAEVFTFPLKSLSDAVRIRSRIIDAFELAILARTPEERKELLSFAVVGGGATGVEMAAEMADFINGMVKRYYQKTDDTDPFEPGHCRQEETKISILHMGKELLEMFAPSLRKAAAERLTKGGVELKLGTTVSEVTKDGLKLSDGSTVPASTVIWTAGVRPVVPVFAGSTPALGGGRLIVDQYFRLQNSERVFALGDVAGYVDVHDFAKDSKNTKAMPMLAQVAVQESKTVAYNVLAAISGKPLQNFHYHSKGSMVSVGQWFAIGEIYSTNIAGAFTWWLWRTVYLFKFASWQKRIRIAIEWTLDFFYPRDITKLT
jgi:NADH dehydrogenase